MLRILIDFVWVTALLLVVSIPVIKASLDRGRKQAPKRWRIGAFTVGLASALLGWSSRDLVQKCVDARLNNCFDPGGAGIRFLLIGGFVAWALLSAYLLNHD